MTTTQGVDYSEGRPGGAALAAAGKSFAMRYLTGSGKKPLTSSEVADLHDNLISIGLIFESVANRALGGHGAGVSDGNASKAAIAALGAPTSCPVYFAVDFDASSAQLPTVDAYLNGAADVLGAALVGVYGGLRTIQHCQQVHSARWFWQTYAWSGGTWASGTHVQQYLNGQSINGAGVDLDRATVANFGQWEPTGGGPIIGGGDVAISTTGLTLTSLHQITLPVGTNVVAEPISGADVVHHVGSSPETFDYFGYPIGPTGWHVVRVDADDGSGTTLGYTSSAASVVKKPPVPLQTVTVTGQGLTVKQS